ncbi:MAG: DUF4136 domain-containing protein [Desulfosarcina sp.]|nr:DUF4136 domain-containing protein [Desulfosarcina sp.]MBC2765735.1 DUF4136 domain-containing protein [Desulfosarcina sp.]
MDENVPLGSRNPGENRRPAHRQPPAGYPYGIGSSGRHGGIAIGTGNSVREYDEGSLVIDLVDTASDALLWRGTGTQRFTEYDDPAKTTGDINALVEKILAQFPPQE